MLKTLLCLSLVPATLLLVGCGSEEPAASVAQAAAPANAAKNGSDTTAAAGSQQAEAVVSQFLDRIRRGAGQASAEELLTNQARSVISRFGGVQSLGAPDAQFVVTRSQPAPSVEGEPAGQSLLVHTVWAEPVTAEDGAESVEKTQVVWAVQQEAGQWRISGMVIELVPGEAPTVIDFENEQQIATLFGGGTSTEEVAEATSESVSR
ncbi:hypothetical protein [Crateriforma spongiae]|uniref:hypothetical protein n=1 Tax=Crateriforma spongiae TaxID=2724528 RepID=UPI0039B09F18